MVNSGLERDRGWLERVFRGEDEEQVEFSTLMITRLAKATRGCERRWKVILTAYGVSAGPSKTMFQLWKLDSSTRLTLMPGGGEVVTSANSLETSLRGNRNRKIFDTYLRNTFLSHLAQSFYRWRGRFC